MERRIADAPQVAAAVKGLAAAVLARGGVADAPALVGIRTRGDVLARRLAEAFAAAGARDCPVGSLDITLYRDDLAANPAAARVLGTEIAFDVTGRRILLVDDVLFTGRTIRAALTELADLGRPRCVELAVLVDRGGRQLPIAADYVALKATVGPGEEVAVRLHEVDGADDVSVRPARRRTP